MTHNLRHESLREEIERRVAAFRERQRRFNDARDAYSEQTFARLRAALDRAMPAASIGAPDKRRAPSASASTRSP